MTPESQPEESSCIGDDPSIPDSETLYRRLSRENPNMYAVDEETGERRPTSAAFKPRPNEDGLSVYSNQLRGQAVVSARRGVQGCPARASRMACMGGTALSLMVIR